MSYLASMCWYLIKWNNYHQNKIVYDIFVSPGSDHAIQSATFSSLSQALASAYIGPIYTSADWLYGPT